MGSASPLMLLGACFVLLSIPWLVVISVAGLVWHFSLSWAYKTAPARWLAARANAVARRLGAAMLADARDSPYLLPAVGLGVFTPSLFVLSWWWQSGQECFSWSAVLAYHVLIDGPNSEFFAQTSILVHKEGHAPKGLFRGRYALLNRFFGNFLGIFYGHVPENYPMGHLRIHHKYDNSPDDLTSTVDYDRSRARSFLSYLPRFFLFWTGISIARHHYRRGRIAEAMRALAGAVLYFSLLALVMGFDLRFGCAYLLLPHLFSGLFLAAATYTWHAWADPRDPGNIYKNTITIVRGQRNTYNEDFHLEHHVRPQAHWTEYPRSYHEHRREYAANRAIVFEDTHVLELFVWLLSGAYAKLADHMLDLSGDMSQADKVALLKERLQPMIRAGSAGS